MKEKILSWNPFFELSAVFALIMIYIWRLRDGVSWMPILMLIVASHFIRGESLNKLGFRPRNPKKCFSAYGEQVFVGAIGCVVYSGLIGILLFGLPLREITLERAIRNLGDDVFSGFFQQYLLNGYFLNRLVGFLGDRSQPLATWLAAVLFSVAHFPNGFLMLVTLWGGYFACLIFLKSGENRNLYFLALAHGLIKFLLFMLVPDRIGHGFRIGPGIL